MRPALFLPFLLMFAACAAPAPIDTDPLPAGDQAVAGVAAGVPIVWSGWLTGGEGWTSLRGSVRVAAGADSTAARASVSGAPTGMTLPWLIREGACAAGGPVVGTETAYPPLRTGSNGSGAAEARLGTVLQGQSYSVELRAGPGEAAPTVACATLERSL